MTVYVRAEVDFIPSIIPACGKESTDAFTTQIWILWQLKKGKLGPPSCKSGKRAAALERFTEVQNDHSEER